MLPVLICEGVCCSLKFNFSFTNYNHRITRRTLIRFQVTFFTLRIPIMFWLNLPFVLNKVYDELIWFFVTKMIRTNEILIYNSERLWYKIIIKIEVIRSYKERMRVINYTLLKYSLNNSLNNKSETLIFLECSLSL